MTSRKGSSEPVGNSARKSYLFRKHRGISTIEYAFLFIILVAAVVGMSIYFKRALSGRWRGAADDTFGRGRIYDPHTTLEYEY